MVCRATRLRELGTGGGLRFRGRRRSPGEGAGVDQTGCGLRRTSGQQREWRNLSGECCSSRSGVWQRCGSAAVSGRGFEVGSHESWLREPKPRLAFAMAGDTARAESRAQDLGKRFPLDTQMQSLWLPTIHAQLMLDQKNPALALNALQAASPLELAQIPFVNNISCLYHVYIRGEAYLSAGQGSAAAAEFQKIIDHSGIVWNCWTGALSHLGVARANALQSRTSHGRGRERTPMPPASVPSPPTKISSPSGKMPTPTSPS